MSFQVSKMLFTAEELRVFLASVKEHWTEIVGGGFVFILAGVLASLGFNIPPSIIAIAVFCLVVMWASFLAFRNQYRANQELLSTRRAFRDECLDTSVSLLKKYPIFMLPMHAVYRAKAYKLEPNDDLCWICSELKKHGHDDPFCGFEAFVLDSERLEFIQWARKQHGIDLSKGNSFVNAAEEWPKLKGRLQPSFQYSELIKPHLNWELAAKENFMSQLPPYDD